MAAERPFVLTPLWQNKCEQSVQTAWSRQCVALLDRLGEPRIIITCGDGDRYGYKVHAFVT
jgi:hypothetical protein